jgi:DNA-binding transcriptional MerR regulator
MRAELSSGDLARATGVTARAIRFYEEQGLLRPALLSGGGHRRYTPGDLERLRLIAGLRELGLSICAIRGALELRTGCEGGVGLEQQKFQEVLRTHIRQAEQRLTRLRRVKRELQSALDAVEERLARLGGSRHPADLAEGSGASPLIVRLVAQGSPGGDAAAPGRGE